MADKILTFNGKTISGPSGTGMVILDIPELPEPEAMTLRFQFSDKSYDPTGVNSKGTWTKVQHPFNNIWDWTCTDTSWATAFGGGGTGIPGKFADYEHNKVMVIDSGDTSAVTDFSRLFQNCYAITSICPFDTSNATTVYCMFSWCYNCEKFPDMDFSNVTSSNGTMAVYQRCTKMITAPNILFPTNNAFNLSNFFYGCTSLKNVPLYNTSQCISMMSLFQSYAINGLYQEPMTIQNIPLFDTHNVTNMQQMFGNCQYIENIPLFDTSNVTNMFGMFNCCISLHNIPKFNTTKVTTMQNMFNGQLSNEQHISMHMSTVPDIDYSNVLNMQRFMRGNVDITEIPTMNISNAITKVEGIFEECINVNSGIKNLYNTLSQIQTITKYSDAFKNCGINTLEGHYQLNQIPTSWGGLLDSNHTVTIGDRVYRTITIGTQEWMVENLELDIEGSVWYNNDPTMKDKGYGKLYTVDMYNSFTPPTGWKKPDVSDFETLQTYTQANNIDMRSIIGWSTVSPSDSIGFYGIPNGYCADTGVFGGIGAGTSYWAGNRGHIASLTGMYDGSPFQALGMLVSRPGYYQTIRLVRDLA